ncbi:unnamed protein product [Allacma fusca]|uniref:Uncharacterized protein n=1 Tax=Allacma fusca TaxID=39272 RepID=A0A8J2M2F8_9HEXA|nr:unnamed protein product [Allacma fusca]
MNSCVEDCGEEIVLDKTGLDPSLLRWATPLLITEEQQMIDAVIAKNKQLKTDNDTDLKRKFGNEKLQKAIQRLKANSRGTVIRQICMEDYNHPPNDTVVQKIHQPRKWERRGKKCSQKISNDCTIRCDVIALKKKFDERLKDSGIDQIGICRLRREYFDQLFDEIIRQVSMSCVERGQVLLTRHFLWVQESDEGSEECRGLMFVNQLEFDNKEFSQEYERLQRNHFQLKELLLSSVKDPTSTMDVSTSAEVKK